VLLNQAGFGASNIKLSKGKPTTKEATLFSCKQREKEEGDTSSTPKQILSFNLQNDFLK